MGQQCCDHGANEPDSIRVLALRKKIRDRGYAIPAVYDCEGAEWALAYTVGLTDAGLPELLVSVPTVKIGGLVIRSLIPTHLATGFTPHPDPIEIPDCPTPVLVTDICPHRTHWATRLYGTNVRVAQILFQEDGRFPQPGDHRPGTAGQQAFPARCVNLGFTQTCDTNNQEVA